MTATEHNDIDLERRLRCLEVTLTRLDERQKADAAAVKLQATEYERRLQTLNHAHEKAIEVQNTYVEREKYEDGIARIEQRLTDFIERYETRHEELVLLQHKYVTNERYEEKLSVEADARTVALNRVDEKFNEFITRYEARQREVDLLLAAQKGSQEQQERAAITQARDTELAVQEAQRKTNKNMAIAGLVLTVIVAIANGIGPF